MKGFSWCSPRIYPFSWRSCSRKGLHSEYQHKETYSLKNHPQRSPVGNVELVVPLLSDFKVHLLPLLGVSATYSQPDPFQHETGANGPGCASHSHQAPSQLLSQQEPGALMSGDEHFQGHGCGDHLSSICSELISEQLNICLRTVVFLCLVSLHSPGKV